MKINYSYIAYPVAAGVFIAWAVTGFLQYMAAPNVSLNAGDRGAKLNVSNEPSTEFIIEKNIFNAETSSVKGTLDAVGFQPSYNPEAEGQGAPASDAGGIKLVGILKGTGESFAILKKPDGNNIVLRQGFEKEGIMLVSARELEVEIEQNGKRSTLKLDIKDPMAGQGDKNAPSSASSADGVDRRSISRQTVIEKLSNINTVMKSVAINPFDREGKFIGYKLSRMKPDSALLQMGLLPGDVIVRLNGKELKNPTVFFDTLANAENLSALTLDLERLEKKKTIYVEIKG